MLRTCLPLLALIATASAAEREYSIGVHRNLLLVTAPASLDRMPGAILNTPMTVDFQDTPLDDVALLISRATGANVVIDPTLRVAGVSVTFKASNMACGNVLNWIRQTARVHIAWVDSAIYFSNEPIQRKEVTKMYDVSDLVLKVPHFPGPEVGYSDMGAGKTGVSFIAAPEESDAPSTEELVDLIENMLDAHLNE